MPKTGSIFTTYIKHDVLSLWRIVSKMLGTLLLISKMLYTWMMVFLSDWITKKAIHKNSQLNYNKKGSLMLVQQ